MNSRKGKAALPLVSLLAAGLLAACAPATTTDDTDPLLVSDTADTESATETEDPGTGDADAQSAEDDGFEPVYESIETQLLDDDLVRFLVSMRGARDRRDVARFADCAASQYTLIRGYGYARHLRTTVDMRGDLWMGDAIYTISRERPRGLQILKADDVVAGCVEESIPTI